MHTVDVVVVCVAIVLVLLSAAVLARQRYMLRLSGAVPFAVQRGNRWLYGIGRYQGGELRWYRALGIGTSPSRVLRRGEVEVLGHRKRTVVRARLAAEGLGHRRVPHRRRDLRGRVRRQCLHRVRVLAGVLRADGLSCRTAMPAHPAGGWSLVRCSSQFWSPPVWISA